MRGEVFPVLARRGLNSGGVSHRVQQFLAMFLNETNNFSCSRIKANC